MVCCHDRGVIFIIKNDVWEIVPRPIGKLVIDSRWLCKTKHATDWNIEKYKARFIASGFSQKEEFDYDETFALVAIYISICTIICIAFCLVVVYMRWM
jgi:hypothetical protein